MSTFRLWHPVAHSSPSFVIDTSVPWDWWFGSSPLGYTSRVISRMIAAVVAVPSIWSVELAERLQKLEKSGKTTVTQVQRYLASVSRFEMLVDVETSPRAWSDILDLARMHSVGVLDAAYLELALRLNLPLATIDSTLTRAARAAGVPAFIP